MRVKHRCLEGALACVGAVIGAGFASGREVVSFFSRYGVHGWWLIGLSAVATTALCLLVMRRASQEGAGQWCALYGGCGAAARWGARACGVALMAVTGGAMVSAAGHLTALLWPSEWAYPLGAVGTLLLAWAVGQGSLRPLSFVSWALTAAFIAAVLTALSADGAQAPAVLPRAPGPGELGWAAVRAVCYAAMNATLAIGVLCRCAQEHGRTQCRTAVLFGLLLVMLLFLSHYLYLKHPEWMDEALPMVLVMRRFGRPGFVVSAALLYLAVFTTLCAVQCALTSAAATRLRPPAASVAAMGVTLAVSLLGFRGIVDGLYAPAGLACLVLVFGPLRRKSPLTTAQGIR